MANASDEKVVTLHSVAPAPVDRAAAEVASSLIDSALQPRRGRPKGMGRTPGSGRKPGTKNRRTEAVAEAMRPLDPKARKTLRALLEDTDPEVRLKAASLILAYRYGKPTERKEVSGPDGGPITSETRVDNAQAVQEAGRAVYEAALIAAGRKPGETP